VFKDMMLLLTSSHLVKAGVVDGRLQVEGAIYHIDCQVPVGLVEWLGTHPDQQSITKKNLGKTNTGLSLGVSDLPDEQVQASLQLRQSVQSSLVAGNIRYLASGVPPRSRWFPDQLQELVQKATSPSVLIVAGANGDARNPQELFDSSPGELLVHRTCGAISGRREGSALRFLERLVKQNPDIPILLVLNDVRDPAVTSASTQVQRVTNNLKFSNAQMAMEQLAPVVVHALRQSPPNTEDASAASQQQKELITISTEMHVGYVMERLLMDSDVIFELSRTGKLEVQGAIVQWDGAVRFIGGHADFQRVVEQRARAEKHNRKGLKLGPRRQDSAM